MPMLSYGQPEAGKSPAAGRAKQQGKGSSTAAPTVPAAGGQPKK